MIDWRKEPAVMIGGGGMALVQALMALLLAFDVPITASQQVAITTFMGVILGFLTRANVTPMSTLPAGVAGEIADAKAVKAAQRDAEVPPLGR